MLRRSTSRSGSSLSRSKSAASVRSAVQDLEHISPADAIRDAHVAATVSFARARNRTRPSTISHPRHSFNGNVQVRDGPGTELHHRRSVRFVRPVVVSRGSASSRAGDTRDQAARAAQPLNELPGRSENRPLSRAPPLYNAQGVQGREDAYFRALRASDDCCTPEDNICSAPSSYRRLRKSKSLFTPSTASLADRRSDCRFSSHQGFRAYTLRADISGGKENQHPLRDSHQLRTPKSLSFLKSRPDIPVRKIIQRENDAAVEMARDMFRRTVEERESLESHPSRFLRSKRKLSEMSSEARRSMRSCSNTTNPFSLAGSSLSNSGSSVKSKVRKASSNLKTKLKRFLNINNKDCGDSLLTDSTGGVDRSASIGASHDQESVHHTLHHDGQPKGSADYMISNVSSRLPSFREVPGSLKSRQCSLESLNSDNRSSTSGHRSSSWSNNGFEAPPGMDSGEWENHRLSVIKEHGNHISPPDYRHTLPSFNSALYHPGNSTAVPNAGLGLSVPRHSVSGERLYSALMRHQREKDALPEEGPAGEGISLPANTDDSARPENRSPLTIRFVNPEDDVFVDRLSPSPSPQPESRHSTLIGSRSSSAGSIVRKPVPPPSNPQAMSAFLASPHNPLFRTGSPYRRSLQEAMRAAKGVGPETPGANYMLSMSDVHLPTRCPSTQDSTTNNGGRYTSSDYSSSTASTHDPLLNTTSNGAIPCRYSSLGSIAMISKETPHWSQSAELMPPEVGSSEWKTWLAAKVAKLEDPGWGRSPACSPGHVRQGAEVDSSDTASPVCSPNEVTKGNVPQIICVPIDGKDVSTRVLDTNENTPPIHETRDGKNGPVAESASPPPPIPTRSSLRSEPSVPYIRTPSSRVVKGRLPKSTQRPNSFLDLPGPGLKRRPGIRLARKARGLRPSSTVSCLGSAARDAAAGEKMPNSLPNSPVGVGGGEGPVTPVMGRKEMVDLFLSSRRRRISGEEGEALV